MSVPSSFDPYREWLGIPPEAQPVNHYLFLGLVPFENDIQRIQQACQQRRSFFAIQSRGERGLEAKQLLEKLELVSACLLNPESKSAYDNSLKANSPISHPVAESSSNSSSSSFSSVTPIHTSQLEPGYKIGQYELRKLVDKNASGMLWKVRHTITGKKCLLKLLPPKSAQRAEVAKRFQREIQLASQLNHENLVVAMDADVSQEAMYYVMPVASLHNLEYLVTTKEPFTVDQVINYMIETARGCEYLHWKGICHRNIRPENLFIDENGTLKVGNFLTARAESNYFVEGAFDEQLTQDGQMLGTIDYMAPEQAASANKADRRSDIYSLGCTMFWLLTGRPLYDEKSVARKLLSHQSAPIPVLSKLAPKVPKALDAILAKMVAKNPDNRYQSMSEVIKALEAVKPSRKVAIPKGKLTMAIVATVVVALAIVALIIILKI